MSSSNPKHQPTPGLIVVRGAGDLATGAIQKLARAGFAVLALETEHPMAIRWRAALCPAVTQGRWQVEDLTGFRVEDWADAQQVWASWSGPGEVVPVLVDPQAAVLAQARPMAVVDAILAKRNVGTTRDMAPVTVGCGPGFVAGEDVDLVIETMRGHQLGRVITQGPALANTGVPGLIAGHAAERVMHSPIAGRVRVHHGIGEIVRQGTPICTITSAEGERVDVRASLDGVIRGMIPDGYQVPARFKTADIDPRIDMAAACDTISDKSRAIGGAVLEAVLMGLRSHAWWAPQATHR